MHLPFYVKKAIELFENDDKGFFMMIEGGQIDYGSHSNDPGVTLFETLDFNEAYKLVYDFYLRHKDETLIVMTADHETGGISIGQASKGYACYPQVIDYQKVSAEKFANILKEKKENNDKPSKDEIYQMLTENFGFNNGDQLMTLTKNDSLRIDYFYLKDFEPNRLARRGDKLQAKIYKTDLIAVNNLADLARTIFSEKAGIGWTTPNHTGSVVPVRAIGVWQEKFSGFYDNTDIPKKIYGDI